MQCNLSLGREGDFAKLLQHFVDLVEDAKANPTEQRTLVSLIGIPGAGKTTLARLLCEKIRDHFVGQPDLFGVVSMDGYHLYLDELEKMGPEAVARRGAPHTFDVAKLAATLKELKENPDKDVFVWGFDHAEKDPRRERGTLVKAGTCPVLVMEGNYLGLMDGGDYEKLVVPMFDKHILLYCDLEEAGQRVSERHVEAGLAEDLEAGIARWESNDLVNGKEILGRLPSSLWLRVDTGGASWLV